LPSKNRNIVIKAAIHQPNFLPWLGYFHKISMVDKFVFFDDVQFPRGKTYGNRVKIRTNNGEAWITVPVLSKGDMQNFNEILINNTFPWQRKILKTIELSYKKAGSFAKYYEGFSKVFLKEYEKLTDLNIALIRYFSEALGLKVSFYLSSEIETQPGDNAEDKILGILKHLGADVYVSGSGAGSRRYIDESRFESEKIGIVWQKFNSPVYPQLWGGDFLPDLSIIDLLFNCGPESLSALQKSNTES
jgi:hypothetical protein